MNVRTHSLCAYRMWIFDRIEKEIDLIGWIQSPPSNTYDERGEKPSAVIISENDF